MPRIGLRADVRSYLLVGSTQFLYAESDYDSPGAWREICFFVCWFTFVLFVPLFQVERLNQCRTVVATFCSFSKHILEPESRMHKWQGPLVTIGVVPIGLCWDRAFVPNYCGELAAQVPIDIANVGSGDPRSLHWQ